MVFKGLFKGGGSKDGPAESLTVDDLIVLERYEEAEDRLQARVRSHPHDLHAHLKLAEVLAALRKLDLAVASYSLVADEYAQEGQYDKGLAVLSRALKSAPLDQNLARKIELYRLARKLDHKRLAVAKGLREGRMPATTAETWILQLPRLWKKIMTSDLIMRLSGEELERLFAACEILRISTGRPLVRAGQNQAELYWVVSGVVEATYRGSRAALRSFSSQDLIGERALLEQEPWPCDLIVKEKAVVVRLDREGLERAMRGNSDPRGLIALLRAQDHDRQLQKLVDSMEQSG
ncbi:MAG: cyclic nucleotide-binding domain-containing protein [Acidobacteriota bacterium]